MMKQLLLILLVFVDTNLAYPTSDIQKLLKKPIQRIVNGYDCSRNQYSHLVSLWWDYFHFCGASLITPYWVLTAGHCCLGISGSRLYEFTIRAGLRSTISVEEGQWSKIKAFYVHENYTELPLDNDICLIELWYYFVPSKNVKITPIVDVDQFSRMSEIGACKTVILMGFGEQYFKPAFGRGKGVNPHAQCVQMSLVGRTLCQDMIPYIGDTVICAMDFSGLRPARDACQGDSGGPMLCQGYQVGLVASGVGCGNPIQSYYMRLDIFKDFIKHVQSGMYRPRKSGYYAFNPVTPLPLSENPNNSDIVNIRLEYLFILVISKYLLI